MRNEKRSKCVSPTNQSADTSRAKSLVIEVCERKECVSEVSANKGGEVTLRGGKDVPSNVPLRSVRVST